MQSRLVQALQNIFGKVSRQISMMKFIFKKRSVFVNNICLRNFFSTKNNLPYWMFEVATYYLTFISLFRLWKWAHFGALWQHLLASALLLMIQIFNLLLFMTQNHKLRLFLSYSYFGVLKSLVASYRNTIWKKEVKLWRAYSDFITAKKSH